MSAALNNRTQDFLTSLDETKSADDAWGVTVAYLRNLGANHVGIQIFPDGAEPYRRWSTPKWVAEMYQETVYPSHDPKLVHCRKSLSPYFYEKEFWDREADLPEPRRRLDEEIIEVGNRAAVAFPNHTAARSGWGYFAFTANVGRDEFVRLFNDRGAEIQLAGIGAFNRILALENNAEVARAGLTRRERECLLWLARGFRYCQIAEQLNLSTVTVEFHISNAKRKLGVRTREQALVRAVQLKIIDP